MDEGSSGQGRESDEGDGERPGPQADDGRRHLRDAPDAHSGKEGGEQ
ncbi:hypothetical protein [Novosphingobium sp. ST904]|nr:hypothetical protein [Novosphingobium sp. ST904]